MYGNYVENYHVALDTLDRLCQNNPKFAQFLEDVSVPLYQSKGIFF